MGDKLVCVTGAAGFAGTHIVRELLSRGYNIHATVRDKEDDEKNFHLIDIAEELGATDRLALFSTNLTEEGSFDAAMQDCEALFHVASPVMITAKDPKKEIVDVAFDGVKNVLNSTVKSGTVKDVILTSSASTIERYDKSNDYIFTEEDYFLDSNDTSDPYALSKSLAEKYAFEFLDELPESDQARIVSVNPTLLLGPVYNKIHLRTSPKLIHSIKSGSYRLIPRLCFGVVDVRDAARVHVDLFENKSAHGRYIISNSQLWLSEIVQIMQKEFPDQKFSDRIMPNWMLYAISLFDKRVPLKFVKNNLGKQRTVSDEKLQKELKFEYTTIEKTIHDTLTSIMEL